MDQSRSQTWWGRHWKWVVAIGCLNPVICCGGPLTVFHIHHSFNTTQSLNGVSQARSQHLVSIGLLESNETVIGFTSNSSDEVSGTFFTDKRVARYWLSGDDTSKHSKQSALYSEIADLSITFSTRWEDAHYITVKKVDGSEFPAYLSDSKEFGQQFFDKLVKEWKANTR